MSFLLRLTACLLIIFSSNLSATIIFNDRVNDASGYVPNPTVLPDIGVGSFDIIGHLHSADRDFYELNLVGSQLISIELTEWTSTYNGDFWIGINDSTANYLNQSVIGENILDAPFNPSLDTSVSSYVFGTRTGTLTLDYGFTIVTAAQVPLPAATWLFGSALISLGLVRIR